MAEDEFDETRAANSAGGGADAAALTAALQGVEGVFVLAPPNFDPAPDFPEARAIGAVLRSALTAAHPARESVRRLQNKSRKKYCCRRGTLPIR